MLIPPRPFRSQIFIVLLIVLSGSVVSMRAARAGTNCNDLAVAVYQAEPVLDSRTDGILKKHPITALAGELRNSGIHLTFNLHGAYDVDHPSATGYVVQRRMLRRLLQMIFPEAGFPEWLKSDLTSERPVFDPHGREIALDPEDSGLFLDWGLEHEMLDSREIEMSLLKMGNPQVFELSKSGMREKLGIAPDTRVASIYTSIDGVGDIGKILNRFPEKPEIVFLSFSSRADLANLKIIFPEFAALNFSDLTLSELYSNPQAISDRKKKYLIFNDTRGRLPELYAASDYAIVIGANNFFEPLMARCPTLIYSGNLDDLGYSIPLYRTMKAHAEATGGAIDLLWPYDAGAAYSRLVAIRPETIQHPAFTVSPHEKKTGLESLLDRLERKIRNQLGMSR